MEHAAPDAAWEPAGERVLVTGASSGIGAAAAVELARAGATVGCCARRADRLAEVLARCREHAPESRMWVVDLADLDAIGAFARRVEAELGRVDVLVNNAGIPKRRRLSEIDPDEVDQVMRLNFRAPVRLTAALLPGMLARDHGRIVNVSSMGAHLAAMRVGAYAASKAALELYTEGLRLDLAGTGVTAQVLVPGSTRTEFSVPRPGNEPPFPSDPNAMEPEAVAAALLDLLRSGDFVRYASADLAGLAAAKGADPNAFLAAVAARLGGRRDPAG